MGLFVSLPLVLYQVVMFVAPGLNPKGAKVSVCADARELCWRFVVGAAFGYRVLFPPMVNFLLNFGSDVATPLISIRSYVNLMLTLLFWMGVIFEIPVVTFFLAKIGLVSPEALGRNRRYAVVAAFILGAVITPTFDPY